MCRARPAIAIEPEAVDTGDVELHKQGNGFLRTLLLEATQAIVRRDKGMKKEYLHRCHRKPKGMAKVAAAARKLAVRLYLMLRANTPYPQIACIESGPRVALVGNLARSMN